MTDRAISDLGVVTSLTGANQSNFHSIWTEPASEKWAGSVQYNDGSVSFNLTATGYTTQYASGPINTDDHLFFDEVPDERYTNAFVSHAGPQQALSAN